MSQCPYDVKHEDKSQDAPTNTSHWCSQDKRKVNGCSETLLCSVYRLASISCLCLCIWSLSWLKRIQRWNLPYTPANCPTHQNKVNTRTHPSGMNKDSHFLHKYMMYECVSSLCRRRRPWAGEHGGLLAGFYRQGDHADLLWRHPTASWAELTCNQTAGNWHRWHHHYIMAPLSPAVINM